MKLLAWDYAPFFSIFTEKSYITTQKNIKYYKPIQLIVLVCGIFIWSFTSYSQSNKINGVSFVASPNPIDQSHILPIKTVHANWAAVMPFGYLKNLDNPELSFNITRQWWGERVDGTLETIRLLKAQNIQVMLKPQLWVWHGEFTGDIAMKSEEDWLILEKGYRDFILCYARIAEQQQIPILCIGTELSKFVLTRIFYWEQLIQDIRAIYSGKLTYAANWDTYAKIPFWCNLDYIGIDAYFPISESKTPNTEEIDVGWHHHKKAIVAIQTENNIPVLFTEYGYRSVDYAGKKPWETSRQNGNINHKAQQALLEGLIETFWKEPWFAGGFLWKWFHDHEHAGGANDNRFTIQNKPAEALLKKIYQKK